MREVQSPSSINTYLLCPRKYFYTYIAELPRKESINLIRGKIAHNVLEDFFDLDVNVISKENCEQEFRIILFDLLKQKWIGKKKQIFNLNLRNEEIGFYFRETQLMLDNWLHGFIDKLDTSNLIESFNNLKPRREERFFSDKYKVQGFIDAIHEGEEIKIVDYKTGKRFEINGEIRRQMGIYALLYKEKNGVVPNKAVVNFLKFGEKEIEIDDALLDDAKKICFDIRQLTESDDIADYPIKIGPLCRWKTGQCDFYEHCFEEKDLKEKEI